MSQNMQQMSNNSYVLWTNTVNYYNHLSKLWEDCRIARMEMNKSLAGNVEYHLDNWITSQQIIFDFLSYFMQQKALETHMAINENMEKINELRGNDALITGTHADNALPKIKTALLENERYLAEFQAKYGFFLKQKAIQSTEDYAA